MMQIDVLEQQPSVTSWMDKWRNVSGVGGKLPAPETEPFTPEGFKIILVTTAYSRGNRMKRGGSMRSKKRNHSKSLKQTFREAKELTGCVPVNPSPTETAPDVVSVAVSFTFDNMNPARKADISEFLIGQVQDVVYQAYRNSGKKPIEV